MEADYVYTKQYTEKADLYAQTCGLHPQVEIVNDINGNKDNSSTQFKSGLLPHLNLRNKLNQSRFDIPNYEHSSETPSMATLSLLDMPRQSMLGCYFPCGPLAQNHSLQRIDVSGASSLASA